MATLFDIGGVTTRASPPSEPPSPALAPFGGDPFGMGPVGNVGAIGGGVGGPAVEADEDASGLLVAPDGVGACVALLRRLGLEKHEAAVLHHELDVATLRVSTTLLHYHTTTKIYYTTILKFYCYTVIPSPYE